MSEGFVRAVRVDEVAPGEARVAVVGGVEVAVVNLGGEFHALDNSCPHAGGPLGEGFVQGDAIVCPLHYWEFDIRTGEYLDDPEVCVRRYETKVEGDEVLVRVG